MQSSNYVPGVSGWKIDENGRLELNDGNRRVIAKMQMVITAGPGMTNDQAQASITESLREEVAAARSDADEALATHFGAFQCNVGRDVPFAVGGDQVILSQAFVDDGKVSNHFSVKMTPDSRDQYIFSGIGLGCSAFSAEASAQEFTSDNREMKVSGDAPEILDKINELIGTVKFGKRLENLEAQIKEETKARADADAQLSASINMTSAGLSGLSARLSDKQ
ncbi:host specificity protein J [Pseudomonas cannabina]|uniref:Host specificity protein J n=1 Tax=Pseudomonas cannabina pv. alisalensis TaxID=757414 RepID=A0ABS1XFD2_PSEC1|nr:MULTISPECIES: hypothetical protein [Pseudomonas syringae group]KPB77969.1 Host specificity protein J [Pseudomonas syringae pv. maculicola]MBM0140205.1 host specificity protein J [Pseudomonas cannabina pv. alisalensis]QQN20084.1 host specificity protein J [Pseudomonas cannabina pv. alisalensis]